MESRLYRYCAKLISRIYVILVTFEGQSFDDREKFYDREKSLENYKKYLKKLQIEINGCGISYPNIIEFEEIKNIIAGIRDLDETQHEVVRSSVFNLIDICKKIQENYAIEDEMG